MRSSGQRGPRSLQLCAVQDNAEKTAQPAALSSSGQRRKDIAACSSAQFRKTRNRQPSLQLCAGIRLRGILFSILMDYAEYSKTMHKMIQYTHGLYAEYSKTMHKMIQYTHGLDAEYSQTVHNMI